ncbi:DUF192 domain-containing protein [Fodinibius sediminis]|uniref:DUF192 domain-containing protein n=1 Tax=Fodinibius sediminis TaxID=1214077 RepID=A0A521E7N6_9BACT|nr:DUF192 domain-containing protein [Fodinibius sediminis]SMO79180.1 hypothetical protein SAMN06265218_11385 [Fodinibius sediminis]
MKYLLPAIVAASLALTIGSCSQSTDQPDPKPENGSRGSRTLEYVTTVSFLTVQGDTISTIEAALADDDKERSQGLMDVQNLPASKGMLFIFDENKPRSFWMANTPLPLDIIFVNANKEIVRIHHSTQPFSEKNLTSSQPAQYVIEVNAGYCVSHDIQEGMKVAL